MYSTTVVKALMKSVAHVPNHLNRPLIVRTYLKQKAKGNEDTPTQVHWRKIDVDLIGQLCSFNPVKQFKNGLGSWSKSCTLCIIYGNFLYCLVLTASATDNIVAYSNNIYGATQFRLHSGFILLSCDITKKNLALLVWQFKVI